MIPTVRPPVGPARPNLIGQPIPRKEDPALLTGHGRFIDDLSPFPNTHHAAVLRSSYPHARIVSIDVAAAQAMDGVVAVITGRDVERMTKPFSAGVEANIPFYCCAIDKVHYVGEPVAVVVARDRYVAEDAIEAIVVEYDALPPVVRILDALRPDSVPLHENVGTNVVTNASSDSAGAATTTFSALP